MERFEDTPELFGSGSGSGTYADIRCGICGTLYNEGADERERYSGDSVLWTHFAGLTVCRCCFARIEGEILARIHHILPWYRRILEKRKQNVEKMDAELIVTEKADSLND